MSLLLIGIRLCSQLLDAEEEAHAVANLVDSHLLEDLLVHLQQVLAIDVILAKQLLVFSTLDAGEIVAHSVFVPILDRVRALGVGVV